jgi:outer membrane protein assembly factor BamA
MKGRLFRLGQITFLENHAFNAKMLRDAFPLKKGDVFARDKVVSGLDSLRKMYSDHSYLDMVSIPDTTLGAAATLTISVKEGPQYHMGKLEILAEKELADRLRLAWTLDEGTVYDATYIHKYIDTNRSLLPEGFTRDEIQVVRDCPAALIAVRIVLDPPQGASQSRPKDIPCEKKQEDPK